MHTGKVPGWILLGGFVLAGVAGFVNAVGLLGIGHPISHVTGNATLFGISVMRQDEMEIRQTGLLVLAFFLGAILCGFIVQQSTAKLGRRYGAALFIESLLLLAAMLYLERGEIWGGYLAAAACGLQNAMVTTYSGAIVRTTHMTGVTTDLGVAVGHWLRGKRTEARRLMLLVALLTGFVGGGILGALCYGTWRYQALWVPVLLTGSTGLAYFLYRHYQHIHSPTA